MAISKTSLMYGWFLSILGGLCYLYQFVLRASPGVMADQLMMNFSIQASALGILASCYYYAYSALQVPLGFILDHWGPKRVLRICTAACTVGVLIFSFAPTLWAAGLGRILVGAGASGFLISAMTLARLWLPPAKFAVAVGMIIMLGKTGGLLATFPLATLVDAYGWRFSMHVLFFGGVALTTLIWLFVRQPGAEKALSLSAMQNHFGKTREGFTYEPRIWLFAFYGLLMYMPLSVFTDIWGVSFIMKCHGVSKPTAALGSTMLFLGTALGAPTIALFSNALQSRRTPMLIAALGSFTCACALIFWPPAALSSTFVLLFLAGFFATGQTLVFTCSSELMPKHMSGVVIGFVNMFVMLGGVIFQPLVGFLLDLTWSGQYAGGLPLYTLTNYQIALSIMPIGALISVVLATRLPNTYPSTTQPEEGTQDSEPAHS